MIAAKLSAGDLVIARDGFDADLDADPRHMIIDTRRGRYIGLYAGPLAVDMSKFTLVQSGTVQVWRQIVPLGKTFASPPVVRAMFKSSYRVGAMPAYAEGWAGAVQDGAGNWTSSGGVCFAGFGVSVSAVTFYIAKISYTTTVAGPTAISYIVAHS